MKCLKGKCYIKYEKKLDNILKSEGKLLFPTLIALCSIALNKSVLSSIAIMGEISISGTMIKVDELANAL